MAYTDNGVRPAPIATGSMGPLAECLPRRDARSAEPRKGMDHTVIPPSDPFL